MSGLGISFGKTLPYLSHKTVTRRSWKDSHAKKFINAFNKNKLIQAFDKDRRYGGKQIGWCRLLCAPYKEPLAAMPDADLKAEGGMCDSVKAFVKRYFKGDGSLEVWVIRFEFIAADKQVQIQTSENLGVCSESANTTNSNSSNTSSIESIHQAQLSDFHECCDCQTKIGSISPIFSGLKSIHQASLAPLGVYSEILYKTNINCAVALPTSSIHQALLAPLGVCCALEPKTNSISAFPLPIKSIHQAFPDRPNAPNVYQNSGNEVNTNAAISFSTQSIHQSSTQTLGVYRIDGNQGDSIATNNSAAESIHQAPVVQGGSGLVYSFWKGESTVNHYRYKVKIEGKWKVKSIHIPAGKLLKVREAIANKSSVAAIVLEILGGKLR